MVKDDTKDQMPLFEIPAPGETAESHSAKTPKTKGTTDEKPARVKESKMKKSSTQPVARQSKSPAATRSAIKKGKTAKAAPGPVPEGDVRLTANIREDLHLKLKIVAATRRTTIGELIEELVEQHL